MVSALSSGAVEGAAGGDPVAPVDRGPGVLGPGEAGAAPCGRLEGAGAGGQVAPQERRIERRRLLRGDQAQIDDLDLPLGAGMAVDGAVRLVERGDGCRHGVGGDSSAGERHLELVGLAEIAHVEAAAVPDGEVVEALAVDCRLALALHRGEELAHPAEIRLGGVAGEEAGDLAELEIGDQQAERRQRAGVTGHQHLSDTELARHHRGVDAAAAAEGDQAEVARIDAALDGDELDRLGHLRDQDAKDPEGGLHLAETGAPAQRLQNGVRPPGIQRHRAAGEVVRVQVAEHDRGVGRRRLLAAAAVAGGAGHRAGAHGADTQAAAGVEPGDAAATRAHRLEPHHRQPQRIAADAPLLGDGHLAVAHQGDIGAGAADVEGDQVASVREAADMLSRDDAGRRPREEHRHRLPTRHACRGNAAPGLHQVEPALALGQPGRELVDVVLDLGAHIGVEGSAAGALVLAEHRVHFARERNGQARAGGADDLGGSALVLRVGVGVEKADGEGLDAEALD